MPKNEKPVISGPLSSKPLGKLNPDGTMPNQVPGSNSKALEHGVKYTATPTLDQWKKDSSVSLATRSDDALLTRIDTLIDEYHKAADAMVKATLRVDLYFTLDYWLKAYKTTKGMNKGREPAVYGLYKYIVDRLCEFFACQVNILPRELELHFGKRLTFHGEKRDIQQEFATYLTRAQVAKYRITFKAGRAYMYVWPGKGKELDGREKTVLKEGRLKVVKADSSTASNPGVFGKDASWGGFAMSMGRELYMARHHCGEGKAGPGENGNFYHSSYLGGDAVMCAGTMRIVDGLITDVANDSGHYQPTSDSFVALLEALRMHGVAVDQIRVHAMIPGTWPVQYHRAKGADFLTARGNWARLLSAGHFKVVTGNAQAQQSHLKESRQTEDFILKLFKAAVAAGVYMNTADGRRAFAAKLQGITDSKGDTPFDGVVNITWIVDAIERAMGRVPPPPLPARNNVAPVVNHHKLPPPPPLKTGHGKLPPPIPPRNP